MLNVTIANNEIEGREPGNLRVRMFDINLQTGEKQPTDIVLDIAHGTEERVNLTSPAVGFEVRQIIEGTSFASDAVVPDVFGISDAYQALKRAIRAIPIIRSDMTLSDAERDAKGAAAWNEVLRLANQ